MSTKLTRDQIAARVAQDIPEGAYVNLGIGLPTLVANHLPADREVILHTRKRHAGDGPRPRQGRGRLRPDQRRQAARHRTARLLVLPSRPIRSP